MKTRFTPHLVDLTFDAAWRSFWRKQALSAFLRRAGVTDLPSWDPDESKRDYLTRLFDRLQETDRGKGLIVQMARFLAEQKTFPDLANWDDSAEKQEAAQLSVEALRSYLLEQDEAVEAEQRKQAARENMRAAQEVARVSRQSLQTLSDRLGTLALDLGSADAGRDFEKWFYDLMEFSEIVCRSGYVSGGRQIDGSITIGDTTYLIECKFTTEPIGSPDVDVFRRKVETKADNTMGILVSISGFNSGAITAASGERSPLLLLDSGHIYRVLGAAASFRDVVERVRRHASQTAEAYLPVGRFDS